MSDSSPRVVVTGIGVVSPIGIGLDAYTASLDAGTSGVAPIEFLDSSPLPGAMAAEVRDFTDSSAKKEYLKPVKKQLRVMCREIQLGVASASQALDHSGLDMEAIDHTRLGIDFGANLMLSPPENLADPCWKCVEDGDASRAFHFDRWGDEGLPAMEPLWLLKFLPNMPACHIGIMSDCRGPSNSITQDEASGNLVLGEAFRVLQRGAADMMVAGTTGTRVHAVKSIHAKMWDELAQGDRPPEAWSRPFDADRNGQVGGEGACTLLLENEEHAKARGATVYATLLGFGASCVADVHGMPDFEKAMVNAMQGALRNSGVSAADIGHVNAHGLSSTTVDAAESRAIHTIFGDRGAEVPVTGLKSYFGNAGSGCGVLELAGSIASMRANGTIPCTLNYETPDPACPLNVVHGEPLATDNRLVLNVNVTRMGQASAAVIEVA